MSGTWKDIQVPPEGRVSVEYPEHEADRALRHRLTVWLVLFFMLVTAGCLATLLLHSSPEAKQSAGNIAAGILGALGGFLLSKKG